MESDPTDELETGRLLAMMSMTAVSGGDPFKSIFAIFSTTAKPHGVGGS